ncbi:hypothetical protein TthAA37_21560 (plasmid) [Thermus thermophilus]|nr:hypothetical protein TthAA220_20550 [Thermus thermophilus]BBL85797.1 hypothetical protein TthAA229_22780 [Thermus thermophilus]BCZ92967.1 hypothetical protein TthAA37_21560 [Thermus thermophilus]BCZ95605.1 hypothetical protein TthAK1_22220 [Thermus thermophilus]
MRLSEWLFLTLGLVGCSPGSSPVGKVNPSPVLASPFQGEFRVTNVSDHEYPFQFQDNNGYLLSWWGEKLPGVDGHQGYDFPMPEGTPLLAVYDGEVTFAGWENPFYCPPLDKTVSGLGVVLRHRLPNGEVLLSIYAHMSEVHVRTGDQVRTGQVLGLSGNTGCSTGPHLHFEMRRLRGTSWPVFDPYGWEGEGEDPWSKHPSGVSSVWLWAEGKAPPLFAEVNLPPNPQPTDRALVAITRVRYMGVNDALNPNNEFVEITVDPRFASGPVSLEGFLLRNKLGETFAFPNLTLEPGASLRVYTGQGNPTREALFWNRTQPAWDNWGDCAQLVYPSGGRYRVGYRSGCAVTQGFKVLAEEKKDALLDAHRLPLP